MLYRVITRRKSLICFLYRCLDVSRYRYLYILYFINNIITKKVKKIMEKINWLEGRVKEVARLYHVKYGVNNITYSLLIDRVVFYSDGFYFYCSKIGW